MRPSAFDRLLSSPIHRQLTWMQRLAVGGLLVFGVISLAATNAVRIGGAAFLRIQNSQALVADVLPPPAYVVEPFLAIQIAAAETDAAARGGLLKEVETARAGFTASMARWRKETTDPVARQQLADVERSGLQFFSQYDAHVKTPMTTGDLPTARDAIARQLAPAFREHRAAVDKLLPTINALVTNEIAAAHATLIVRSILLLATFAASVTLVVLISRRISGNIGTKLAGSVSTLEAISQGDFSVAPAADEHTEIGRLGIAMQRMLDSLQQAEGLKAEAMMETRARGHKYRGEAQELLSRAMELREVVDAAAEGDLTREITIKGDDPLGMIGERLDVLFHTWRVSLGTLASNARELSHSSRQMESLAGELTANARNTAERAEATALASGAVGAGVDAVASATEEMAGAIQEISRSASEATSIAHDAVTQSQNAGQTMHRLGEATSEIAAVAQLITNIARQTNLLALNATIEAARAGEHGKGFAVVSNEVKALAQQTDAATRTIGDRLAELRNESSNAVGALEEVHRIIDTIADRQSTIASAVEEQTATANEMTRSVKEAAGGAQTIDQAIAQLSASASSTLTSADRARAAASAMADLAQSLSQVVGRFRTTSEPVGAGSDPWRG